MNWSLIPMPAPEELAGGYIPTPSDGTEGDSAIRRFLITLFAIVGLSVGIQSVASESAESGQRRVAEVNIAERKTECRTCIHLTVEGVRS